MSRLQLLQRDALTMRWPRNTDLVIADPPWTYNQRFISDASCHHYTTMTTPVIAGFIDRLPGKRLALWISGPIIDEFARLTSRWSWGRIRSVGTWVKSKPNDRGHYGPGFHWAGCAEFVLVYGRSPLYTDRSVPLRNAWIEPPGVHSAKPIEWQRQWVQRWCPPEGLVIDPFAGSGSAREAVRLVVNRRYLGTEIRKDKTWPV